MYTKTNEIIVETKTISKTFKNIFDWANNDFESSSCLTEEFAAFAKDFKSFIQKQIKGKNLSLVGFNRGHFYLSGFIKNDLTNKFAYFSTSDVRGCSNAWLNHVLFRTAAHEKDFSGGCNQYSSLKELVNNCQNITEA